MIIEVMKKLNKIENKTDKINELKNFMRDALLRKVFFNSFSFDNIFINEKIFFNIAKKFQPNLKVTKGVHQINDYFTVIMNNDIRTMSDRKKDFCFEEDYIKLYKNIKNVLSKKVLFSYLEDFLKNCNKDEKLFSMNMLLGKIPDFIGITKDDFQKIFDEVSKMEMKSQRIGLMIRNIETNQIVEREVIIPAEVINSLMRGNAHNVLKDELNETLKKMLDMKTINRILYEK